MSVQVHFCFVYTFSHGRRRDFFQGGALGDFSKICLGGPKMVKIVVSHWKLRKQPFFAEIFKIEGACPHSDAHAFNYGEPTLGPKSHTTFQCRNAEKCWFKQDTTCTLLPQKRKPEITSKPQLCSCYKMLDTQSLQIQGSSSFWGYLSMLHWLLSAVAFLVAVTKTSCLTRKRFIAAIFLLLPNNIHTCTKNARLFSSVQYLCNSSNKFMTWKVFKNCRIIRSVFLHFSLW